PRASKNRWVASAQRARTLLGLSIVSPTNISPGTLWFSCCGRGYGRSCSGAFLECMNRVYRQTLESLEQPTRPTYFDPLDFLGLAKPEMHAHVVVGDKTRTAANFIDQCPAAYSYPDACTNCVAVRLCRGRFPHTADHSEGNPMITTALLVHEQA